MFALSNNLLNVNFNDFYQILLPLGLILFVSKMLGLFSKKLGLPEVIGILIAGVLLGLIQYLPNQDQSIPTAIFNADVREGLNFLAKIGVVLIMFSTGLGTDLKQLKNTGGAAVVITVAGVAVPMLLGFLVAFLFGAGENLLQNMFYGVILTATSVAITVETLKEMGKLNSKIGTAIVSAAILDDIIGIVLLSFIAGLAGAGNEPVWWTIVKIVMFILLSIASGLLMRKAFAWLDRRWEGHKRIFIFAFAFCFILSYCAERFFGVADITGAFFAGLAFSGSRSAMSIEKRDHTISYMLFTPVFFSNIGIKADFSTLFNSGSFLLFGLCFVLAGIVGKLVGCGFGAKLCKFSNRDSFRAGIGMMARAEVVLVCTEKGMQYGMIDSRLVPFVLILIMITSLLTPMLLKMSYRHDPDMVAVGTALKDPSLR